VYIVRMARINVYVPDDLADEARSAALNVSAITQEAIRHALSARSTAAWLDSLDALEPVSVTSSSAHRALDEARDELWGAG
jgi:post-segregation antitoxin (ccd killing protein)